ncbi:MAG TPA: hypothetical protein PKH01_04575 [Pseudomonadales bacterium]|nr:hypothetical protein [Pseudomonadales bacterium]
MKILAHGHYSAAIHDDALPPLKDLVKETTGETVRRVGRFIQLALIGAGRCLQQHAAPADTAVYITSGRGDLETTLEVLTQMVEHGLPPKPLSFINTVSNSACFYVAKQFALQGRSQFVTRCYAPLESALQLAALDLQTHAVRTALVGSVDICTQPLCDHRQRIDVAQDTLVGEGSHWFLLAQHDAADSALATIDRVVTLADRNALTHWLQRHTAPHTSLALACGQHLDAGTMQWLRTQIEHHILFTVPHTPWYDSHCGNTLGAFLQQKLAQTLLHIDCDPDGRFTVLQVSQ